VVDEVHVVEDHHKSKQQQELPLMLINQL